jgi:precorrin-2 dehydrogenase/sirohydrochlorin ferrochelatase
VKYYPVFLNLKNQKTVVIGGGKVAERKTRTLLKAGASVKIISPSLTNDLGMLSRSGKLTHIKRSYRKKDIKEAFLVIAATSSLQTNTEIADDAEFLVNVVDAPSEGNFIAPSIVRRGRLSIAIATEGASPAISKAIRKEIEQLYGRDFALYLGFAESIRRKAMNKITDIRKRERFLKSLASERIFKALRNKGFRAVSKTVSASLDEF